MKETNEKKLVGHFLAGAAVFLGGMALLVVLVDPFFHYHKPWFGLKPLQTSHHFSTIHHCLLPGLQQLFLN